MADRRPSTTGRRDEFIFMTGQPIDPNMYAEMNRRRVQRLLSTTLFICFLLMFLDPNPRYGRKNNRHHRSKLPSTENPFNPFNDTNISRPFQMDYLSSLLPSSDAAPYNATGIFSGEWQQVPRESYQDQYDAEFKTNSTQVKTVLSSVVVGNMQQSSMESISKGSLWLFLKTKTSHEPLLNQDVAYVSGQVILHDTQSSFATTIFAVQGSLLRKSGKLTLFGNRRDATVQLLYPSPPFLSMDEKTNLTLIYPDLHFTPDGNHMLYDVLPATPSLSPSSGRRRKSFRPSTIGETCFYQMDLMVSGNATEEGSLVTNGLLSSANCGLYMNVTTSFGERDLSDFYTKASNYGTLMTLLACFQIYVLMSQLQVSDTPATASKVSLVTVGGQAIVDSYLCLSHLTAGIVAQSSFAAVAFLKLILFSVLEMRYLLLIWKARNPQAFADGWNTMRRELTLLYSRFYGTLLIGVLLIYNVWSLIDWFVFVAFSYWVPQIIHAAISESRNPLSRKYLFGMSISRLILPLYIYGCPQNFVAAFPMYQYQSNPTMCIVLVVWTGVQVAMLLLQDKLGPRFFVPAMFLPVKYSYERRIAQEQLSLLKADNFDCVICMVPVEVEKREYMITPCDHLFHRSCLKEWMEVKMECPTCRSALPPV